MTAGPSPTGAYRRDCCSWARRARGGSWRPPSARGRKHPPDSFRKRGRAASGTSGTVRPLLSACRSEARLGEKHVRRCGTVVFCSVVDEHITEATVTRFGLRDELVEVETEGQR